MCVCVLLYDDYTYVRVCVTSECHLEQSHQQSWEIMTIMSEGKKQREIVMETEGSSQEVVLKEGRLLYSCRQIKIKRTKKYEEMRG